MRLVYANKIGEIMIKMVCVWCQGVTPAGQGLTMPSRTYTWVCPKCVAELETRAVLNEQRGDVLLSQYLVHPEVSEDEDPPKPAGTPCE